MTRSSDLEDEEATRFLPPEPPGPEPDLSGRPAPEPPPQQTYGYPPPAGQGQPPGGQGQPPPGYGQPPQGYGQAPPGYGQAPPGYGPPPPPGYGYPPPPPGYGYPAPWAYQPPVPDNGQAVGGFVFSIVAVGLLVISFGLSTIVSLGCAITGIVMSRNGKRKIESGETPKHRGLAQAGLIIGWVGVGLSLLAIAGWIAAFAISGGDDSFRLDPDQTREVVALMVWG